MMLEHKKLHLDQNLKGKKKNRERLRAFEKDISIEVEEQRGAHLIHFFLF